jgi:hypothetical protein
MSLSVAPIPTSFFMSTIDSIFQVVTDLTDPSKQEKEALVTLMLFLGITFPIMCLIATAAQCWQLKQQRLHALAARHYVQRVQLEAEMQDRAERGLNFIPRRIS